MTNYNWEDVEVPRGAFISWGNQTGQHVTGKVLSFDPTGGTDAKGNICPQLALELIEPAASINRDNVRTDFPAGELVVLNIGQVSLRRAVNAASLTNGDLVKITLENLVKATNGTVKEFSIKVARGAGGNVKPQPKSFAGVTSNDVQAVQPQSAPPF